MNNPLVTVVVPVYNVEKYLDRCIESIVNQTYDNLEIILVDDGSPDKCPQMCDDWAKKDNRIKVIHKDNAGLGMARNSGMEVATGEYILFVDSDDYIDKSAVKKSVDTAINSQSQVVMFGHSNFDDFGNVTPLKMKTDKLYFEKEELLNDLLPGLFVYDRGLGVRTGNKMFSLDLFKTNNLQYKSEREIISEDAFFILQLFKYVKKVAILSENLYFYYQNPQSLTSTYREDRQEKNNYFLLRSLEEIEANNYPICVAKALKIRYHAYTISALKQILNSDLSDVSQKQEIYKIFKDKTLKETLSSEVLDGEKKSLKLFYYLVRYEMYGMAFLMLKIRARKERMRYEYRKR